MTVFVVWASRPHKEGVGKWELKTQNSKLKTEMGEGAWATIEN
jgi:hypothetical protein